MSAVLPYKWGRYWLLYQIESGGMADIYVAVRVGDVSSKLLAIKRIKFDFARDVEFLQMFKNEVQISFELQSPRIVQTLDFDLDTDEPYVIMEFVEGVSLSKIYRLVDTNKVLPSHSISIEIIRQTALGLEGAHEHHDATSDRVIPVIHRDISPQNIMVNSQGFVKIIDFGIAKSKASSVQTAVGKIKGKPTYMSPEQIQGERDLDGRSDIFSLGVVMWELLTRKRLFKLNEEHPLERSLKYNIVPPHMEDPKIPRAISDLTMEALRFNVEDRIPSARIFAKALKELQSRLGLAEGHKQVADYVKSQFAGEILHRREHILAALAKTKEKISKIKILR